MSSGKMIYVIKAIIILAIMIVVLYFITVSVEANTSRFGKLGWIPILVGLLTFAVGVIAAWATVISLLDRRALRRYRADPEDRFEDGQTVALSGRVKTEGEALVAPFSQRRCAGYQYQVSGQRARAGDSSGTRQQLCLLGFHLERASLDCGSRRFALNAIADVDTDLRSITNGGEWGERGLAMIRRGQDERTDGSEEDARGQLEEARRETRVPRASDYFVASTRATSNQINVIEDVVPVDEELTILGTYVTRTQGLAGRRLGGMKVFAGTLDVRLEALGEEIRKGLMIGLPLLFAGFALLGLSAWWPR